MKLLIKIKVRELNHIKTVVEKVKELNLENSPQFNPEIIIELGE